MENNMRKKFKEFYLKEKDEYLFNGTFDKYYTRGHWGRINKKEIKSQQKEWFYRLKDIIEDKDYGSLIMAVGHRDNKVSRELFTKMTHINIKKKTTKYVEEKIKEFCLSEFNQTLKIGVVGFSDDSKFEKDKAHIVMDNFFDFLSKNFSKNKIEIVSGLTNVGIPKLAYEKARIRKWRTVGITAKEAEQFKMFPVDEKRIVGEKFGDESEFFINNVDMLVKFGGGPQSKKEVKMAKERGIKVYEFDL